MSTTQVIVTDDETQVITEDTTTEVIDLTPGASVEVAQEVVEVVLTPTVTEATTQSPIETVEFGVGPPGLQGPQGPVGVSYVPVSNGDPDFPEVTFDDDGNVIVQEYTP